MTKKIDRMNDEELCARLRQWGPSSIKGAERIEELSSQINSIVADRVRKKMEYFNRTELTDADLPDIESRAQKLVHIEDLAQDDINEVKIQRQNIIESMRTSGIDEEKMKKSGFMESLFLEEEQDEYANKVIDEILSICKEIDEGLAKRIKVLCTNLCVNHIRPWQRLMNK